MRGRPHGAQPITYPPASGASLTSLAPAPLRLIGWSFTPAIGQAQEVSVSNPAAGADATYTVTGPCQIAAVTATLTTSATVANRFLHLQVLDLSSTVVVDMPGSGAVVASSSLTAYWEQGLSNTSAGISGTAASAAPLLTLQTGWTIKIHVNAIQAADQLSAITLVFNTAGSAGQQLVTIKDGAQVVAQFDASNAGIATFSVADSGIAIRTGLAVTVTSGSVSGVLWVVIHDSECEEYDQEWQRNRTNLLSLSQREQLASPP